MFLSYPTEPFSGKLPRPTSENVQGRAGMWITGREENYKEALEKLKLLPLSLYHELHVLLLLVDIMNNEYTLHWTRNLSLSNATQATRSEKLTVFETPFRKSSKQVSDFWTRESYLANKLGKAIGIDVHSTENPKKEILHVYWTYFYKHYDPAIICTWRLSCACSSCKDIKKLDFMINWFGTENKPNSLSLLSSFRWCVSLASGDRWMLFLLWISSKLCLLTVHRSSVHFEVLRKSEGFGISTLYGTYNVHLE